MADSTEAKPKLPFGPERQLVVHNRCLEILHDAARHSMEPLQTEPLQTDQWKVAAFKLREMVQHLTGYPEAKPMP